MKGMAVTEMWLKKHRPIYLRATRNPFILSLRDGSVDFSSFKRWLGQEYLFVRAFIPFVSSVLLKAWKETGDNADIDVILGGINALNDEIDWSKREASKWGVALDSIVHHQTNLTAICRLYSANEVCDILFIGGLRFLESLVSEDVDFTETMTALWAIEGVYQDSFAHCLEDGYQTPHELKETCQRWGNDTFGQYCSAPSKA